MSMKTMTLRNSPATFHVSSPPWPAALPHPLPLDVAETIWLSVVPDIRHARAYHEAWRAAGYTGLIYIAQLRAWRLYRRGWYVRSETSLQAAAAHVGLPSALTRAGLRLAALLHRAATLLARACRRYEHWRLMRRARRVLAERGR